MRLRTLGLIALVLACACSGHAITGCPDDLRVSVTPTDTTIAAGEQFTARMTLLGCGARTVLSDTVTFQSSDLSVAVVGITTGVVIGAHPGTATIRANAQHYHVAADVHVVVR